VTGGLANSVERIQVPVWTVIVFVLLGSTIYLASVTILRASGLVVAPKSSAYPLVNFGSAVASGYGAMLSRILASPDAVQDPRKSLEPVRLYFGELSPELQTLPTDGSDSGVRADGEPVDMTVKGFSMNGTLMPMGGRRSRVLN